MASWFYLSSFCSFTSKNHLLGETEAFANISKCPVIHNIHIFILKKVRFQIRFVISAKNG